MERIRNPFNCQSQLFVWVHIKVIHSLFIVYSKITEGNHIFDTVTFMYKQVVNSFTDTEIWWNIYAHANWVITVSCMAWWQPGTTQIYHIWQILFKDTYTLHLSHGMTLQVLYHLHPLQRIDIWYHSVQNYVLYLFNISMLKEIAIDVQSNMPEHPSDKCQALYPHNYQCLWAGVMYVFHYQSKLASTCSRWMIMSPGALKVVPRAYTTN